MASLGTTLDDYDRNGVYDHAMYEHVNTDESGKISTKLIEKDSGYDGVVDYRGMEHYGYDDQGRLNWQWVSVDNDGDFLFESETYRDIVYDAYGRVLTDTLSSPDLDGDGAPDYSQVMSHSYDANGKVTAKETLYYSYGQQSTSDYRLETFSYNKDGLLYEHYTDDWAFFDYVVGRQHHYDNAGRLTKVKILDPFVFGDEAWHNSETYKYNSKGQLIEKNFYDEFFNGSHVLEVKIKLEYNKAGQVVKELATGQEFSWKTVEKQMTEHWYNANGKETTTLISFDENLDGRWDAGTRTLIKTAYDAEGDIMSQIIDYNAGDGFAEHVFTVESFDGLIA